MDVNFVLCSVLVRFTVSRSVEAPSTGTVAVGCAVVVELFKSEGNGCLTSCSETTYRRKWVSFKSIERPMMIIRA